MLLKFNPVAAFSVLGCIECLGEPAILFVPTFSSLQSMNHFFLRWFFFKHSDFELMTFVQRSAQLLCENSAPIFGRRPDGFFLAGRQKKLLSLLHRLLGETLLSWVNSVDFHHFCKGFSTPNASRTVLTLVVFSRKHDRVTSSSEFLRVFSTMLWVLGVRRHEVLPSRVVNQVCCGLRVVRRSSVQQR